MFRIGSVDIGLENVAVASTRVADRPSRSSSKGAQMCRCFQLLSKLLIFVVAGARSAEELGVALSARGKHILVQQALFWAIQGRVAEPESEKMLGIWRWEFDMRHETVVFGSSGPSSSSSSWLFYFCYWKCVGDVWMMFG